MDLWAKFVVGSSTAAPSAKFQREIARQHSRRDRAAHIAAVATRLREMRATPSKGSPAWVALIRDHKHAVITSWRRFHLLQPWMPACAVPGDAFAALLRYQFRLSRKGFPATMTCNCRKKDAPPRHISSADYHALTCGFGPRIRKSTHDHVCTLATKALNDGGCFVGTEVARPEAPHGGHIPDII